MVVENIGLGVVAGIVWAAIGYGVAKVKTGEEFSGKNFATSVVVGLVLGVLSLFTGKSMTEIENYSTVQMFTIVIDKLIGMAQKGKKKEVK